jgi:oligoribonuclease NrnB/cAMP/cGMP phosphodiesterase (DHH superfamily)
MLNELKEKIMFNVISLSHIDLDGISCQLVLDQVYGNIKTYNCNYDKIPEYLDYIDDNCSEFRPELVYITDLSFETKYAIKLAHIIKDHPDTNFIYIDHHPYSDDLKNVFEKMKKLPNFKYIHSEKACATKLTYKYIDAKYKISTPVLEKYVESVNAYDIWLEDSAYFKVGFAYNELFFFYKLKSFFFEMRDSFHLKDKHKEQYRELVKKKNEYFAKVKSNKLIFEDNNKLFIFADEYRSWITIDFPNFDYYVVATTYARMSVRISRNITDEKAEEVKNYIIENKDMNGIISIGGHHKAFGITMEPNPTIEHLLMHVQDMSKLLDKIV